MHQERMKVLTNILKLIVKCFKGTRIFVTIIIEIFHIFFLVERASFVIEESRI